MLATNTKHTDKLQRSVLGTIILDQRCFFDVSSVVSPMMFSGWLGAVATEVWEQLDNGKLSISSLAFEVEKKHQIDQSSVFGLADFANPMGLIKDAETLRGEYLRGQEIGIHENTLSKLKKGFSVDQVLIDAQNERELLQDFSNDQNETRANKLNQWLDNILDAKNGKRPIGIELPYAELSEAFGGLHRTNYTIIAARPGAGKTTLLLDLILHAVRNKIPSLFFSLEMSYNEVLSLLAQKITGVSNKRMRSGQVDDSQLMKIQEFMEELYELPIYIETGVSDIGDLKHKARMYSKKYEIQLVGIDYVQLLGIRDFRGNRNSELEKISRGLKSLASEKDCNVALITLAQIGRAVEHLATKRPSIAHLKDSGSLEQDADNIILMYRPDYYGIMEDEEGDSTKGIVEAKVAKNRHVSDSLPNVKLRYDPIRNQLHSLPKDEFKKPDQFDQPKDTTPKIVNITPNRRNDDDEIPF